MNITKWIIYRYDGQYITPQPDHFTKLINKAQLFNTKKAAATVAGWYGPIKNLKVMKKVFLESK